MTLYEGRLPDQANPLMDRLNRSLPFDIRLLPNDVTTNRAWASELHRLGVFNDREIAAVYKGLDQVLDEFHGGKYKPLPEDEDVHTLVERRLTEITGSAGGRIHTGRSRNDQVVCDLRLFTRDRLDELIASTLSLIEVLKELGSQHRQTLLAGTTHMQPALPITLGQFLCSLAFALVRDAQRLVQARQRVNLCPLGSGAMAGSGFHVDRRALARAMGFNGILENSVDAVSDRDFCTEPVQACALLAGHLSRYAEQFIIWANPRFGYIRFDDRWSTGSSMMPQKRNPDAMELVRGKAARVMGAATTLLSLTKGLPLTYAKDLQEDKEPLFDALDTTFILVEVFREALASASFNTETMVQALSDDMLATDLADALTRVGVPFRTAHHRVAAMVSKLEAQGKTLLELDAGDLSQEFPEFGNQPPELSFENGVGQRRVEGGTAPQSVDGQIESLTVQLAALKASLKKDQPQ